MVVYHAFKAAYIVSRNITAEIQTQSGTHESVILTPTGEKASFTVVPTEPFLYKVRLYGTACVFLCLCGFTSFLAEKRSGQTHAKDGSAKSGAVPQSESAFSVTIEYTFFSGAQGDEFSTPFAVARGWANACMVSPAQIVFYLRIRNERPIPTMVTAYIVRANDKPFLRLRTDNARVVMLVESGTYKGGDVSKVSRLPQGTGQASYVKLPVKDLDFKHAFPFTPTTFDQQIVGKAIEPFKTIQGFTFFNYPFNGYFLDPRELWIDIIDDSGKKSAYPIAMETGDPNADVGARTLGIDNPVDLSRCRIMPPHP